MKPSIAISLDSSLEQGSLASLAHLVHTTLPELAL